jgi:hypothetical protein
MTSTRWQDWVNIAAGLWLILSNWLFGFSPTGAAFWVFAILGFGIASLAIFNLMVPGNQRLGWISVLLGFFVFVTPWFSTFGFMQRWNAWIIGAIVVTFALWELAKPNQEHKPHPV